MKQPAILYLLLAPLLLLGLSTCNSPEAPGCMRSTGPDKTEQRSLPGEPRKLLAFDNVNCWIGQCHNPSLTLVGGKNLLPEVKTQVNGLELAINNNNGCNWVRSFDRGIQAYVGLPHIDLLRLNGYGHIYAKDTLRGQKIQLECYGAGEMKLPLRVRDLIVDFNGMGFCQPQGRSVYAFYFTMKLGRLDAGNMITEVTDLEVRGENDLTIHATQKVRGTIHSNANVYIYGHPKEVTVVNKGKGRIIYL